MVKMRLLFKGIYEGMGRFGKLVSSIINIFLLLLVFVFGVGLVSIFSRIFGKKYLEMNLDKNSKTYWQDSIIGKRKKEDYYKPF